MSPRTSPRATYVRAVIASAIAASIAVVACSSESTDSPDGSPGVFGGTSSSSGSGTSTAGVDCTHPGAGSKISGDRCECTTTHKVAGEWSAKRSCREGVGCPIADADETFTLTQTGTGNTDIRGTAGSGFTFTGTLCGDFIVFDGAKGGGTECGQLRLTDDTHFFLDSCIVASGECNRSFGSGCPSEKSQCTGTGAKKPEAAAAIVKDICH